MEDLWVTVSKLMLIKVLLVWHYTLCIPYIGKIIWNTKQWKVHLFTTK